MSAGVRCPRKLIDGSVTDAGILRLHFRRGYWNRHCGARRFSDPVNNLLVALDAHSARTQLVLDNRLDRCEHGANMVLDNL